MSNNQKIFRNTIFLYARLFIVLLVSIYTTRVILRVLGVEDYGIYNVVCGFVSMFGFLNSTMANCVQRFYSVEDGRADPESFTKFYRTSVLVQLISVVLLLCILEPLGIWYINNKMVIPQERLVAANWVFQSAVISLALVFLQVPYNAAIIAKERLDFYAIVSVGDAFLKLFVVIIIPSLPGDSLIVYGLLLVLISFINFLLNYLYSKKTFPELGFKFIFYKKHLESLLSFTGWNLLEMFAWMTQGQGISLVLNSFFGPVINAAQGVSVQIQNAIQSFCSNLITAFRPQLIQSYARQEHERVERMMFAMSKAMFVFFFIFAIPIIVEIQFVLELWLGENVPEYTSIFTTLLLLSMFPRNFVAAFSQIIHASGKIKQYQIASAFIILSILPLSYFLLYKGAMPYMVYVINLICCLFLFVACMFLLRRQFYYNLKLYLLKTVLPCLILASIVTIVSYIIKSSLPFGLLRFIVVGLTSTFLTVVLSFIVVLNREERHLIIEFIKKKKRHEASI